MDRNQAQNNGLGRRTLWGLEARTAGTFPPPKNKIKKKILSISSSKIFPVSKIQNTEAHIQAEGLLRSGEVWFITNWLWT